MMKQLFLVLSVVALFTACNNASETAAPPAAAEETTVKVEVSQPDPPANKVEVDNGGVKINVTGKDGSQIQIEGDAPKQ